MTVKLILMLLLIRSVLDCRAASDYSYDDDEEIPDALSSTTENSSTSLISLVSSDDDDEQRRLDNDVLLETEQLEQMSAKFRKVINKIKTKHKKIEMIFLVDSSSSVGKENFANEISFVKRLLSDFNVSFNYTRVALITFSSRSKIVSFAIKASTLFKTSCFLIQIVHINQISEASSDNDKCKLLNHQIPNITYSGGGTNTFSALLKAKV